MVFTIDSSTAYLNGLPQKLDAPASIINSRTFVPVRFISENMGYRVDWNGSTRTVSINGMAVESPSAPPADTDNSTGNTTVTAPETKPSVTPPATNTTPVPEQSSGSSSANNNSSTNVSLNSITAVHSGSKCIITVKTGKKVTAKFMRLSSPNRLVFDFYGTTQKCKDGNKSFDSLSVKEVRWAAHEDYTRLVVETTDVAEYIVNYPSDGECVISVSCKSVSSAPATTTPPTASAPSQSTTSKDGLLVVIDPGHGGFDTGAVGRDSDGKIVIYEKTANLKIALKLYDRLKAKGVNVIMTRTKDVALGSTIMEDLVNRAEFANKAEADLFVSIHNNAFTDEDANGTCVLYAGIANSGNYGISSQELAQNIQTPLVKATGLKDRGIVRSPNIVVLKRTDMPAALVECAFVTNENDRKVLLSDAKLNDIADAICEGIIKSLKKMKKN